MSFPRRTALADSGSSAANQPPGNRPGEVNQLAGFTIQASGVRRRAWHDDFILIDNQVALRSQSADGLRVVRLLAKQVTQTFIPPDNVARCDVHRQNEDTFKRPDARREINLPVGNDRAASNRPDRNQPPVAQQSAIVGSYLVLPPQPARRQLDAVEKAIVRAKADRLFPHSRSKSNRTIRAIIPKFPSCRCVVRCDRIVAGRGD